MGRLHAAVASAGCFMSSRPSLNSRIVKGCPRLVTSVIAPLRAAASAAKALLRGALTTHVRPGFMWIDKRGCLGHQSQRGLTQNDGHKSR